MKTTDNQIKRASEKIKTRKINRYFLEQNKGLFLNATWPQVDSKWAKAAKVYLNIAFCEKVLNSNWLETLRIKWNPWESLLYLRPTEAFHYHPGYVIRLQKERQTQAKFERKRCPRNQFNIKVIIKKIKIFVCVFLGDIICKSNGAHYCDTVKRKQKIYIKGANLQKSWKLV